MSTVKKLRIKLIKSTIARLPSHRESVKALGLTKINQTVEREDTPQIRGLIRKVGYMLSVEE
jgi:large subunit ribosomal protein L30